MFCPLIFGEILFDRFPDGAEVLGGAPFNVAWNLRALGFGPRLISRIGRDAAGRRILEALESWDLDAAGVQLDRRRPTGSVRVLEESDGPAYEIAPGQAWDRMDPLPAGATAEGGGAVWLYHGTLALRDRVSRAAWDRVRGQANVRFVDLNLRDPWWDRDTVEACLAGAHHVKLNEDELVRIGGSASRERDPRRLGRRLSDRFGIGTMIVTRGDQGAFLLREGRPLLEVPAREPARVVDTVGAGDAFSAVALAGLHLGWTDETLLRRASAFAGTVCGFRGATTFDRAPYRATLAAWAAEEPEGA